MAGNLEVKNKITDANVSSNLEYGFLYEPLMITVTSQNATATKLFIDISCYTLADSLLFTKTQYVEYDLAGTTPIDLDLMKIVSQLVDTDIYKVGDYEDINENNGYLASPNNKFKFKFYTDLDPVADWEIFRRIIVGGRSFEDYTTTIDINTPSTEFVKYGIDAHELSQRWNNLNSIIFTYDNPSSTLGDDAVSTPDGDPPEGGLIVWKSRFGGWMFWGFDIQDENFTNKYSGNIEAPLFEAVHGGIYVPPNYTNIETSYTRVLKAKDLSMNELRAVSGIHASPAIYYVHYPTGKYELMKLSSFSAPINSLASGGDFTVTLASISNNKQNSR